MKNTCSRLAALVAAILPGCALAFPLAADFYLTNNNAFFTAQPDPARPGYLMDGVSMIRTDSQNELAITTYADFPAGVLNNNAGITILIPGNVTLLPSYLNALNLVVGNDAIRPYSGLFTDVFGIHSPGVFGFGGSAFVRNFGIPGSPMLFAFDGPRQNANRFLTAEGITNGYRAHYASNPVPVVPDGGATAVMLAGAIALMIMVRARLEA